MINEMTPEIKEQYILLRDKFKEKKNATKDKINEYNLIINQNNQEISKLEKSLKESRPKIEGCDNHMVCKRCDIYSMEFLGSTPNPDKVFLYKCVICNERDYHT